MLNSTDSSTQLTLSRKFSVPVETLYHAWSNAEQLKKWHAPDRSMNIKATADVQAGGKYCISMTNTNDGKVHTVVGTYQEVVPNKKLIYTWQWKNTDSGSSENHPETLVTLEFKSIGINESELILTHERFADEKTCEHHNQGWAGCIGNLEQFLHENQKE